MRSCLFSLCAREQYFDLTTAEFMSSRHEGAGSDDSSSDAAKLFLRQIWGERIGESGRDKNFNATYRRGFAKGVFEGMVCDRIKVVLEMKLITDIKVC